VGAPDGPYSPVVSPFDDPPSDRPPQHRRDPDLPPDEVRRDLEALRANPSLAWLRVHSWRLDGLPVTTLVWAFLGSLFTTILAFGPLATPPLVLCTLIGLCLGCCGYALDDLATARVALHVTRAGLLAWMVLSAACVG